MVNGKRIYHSPFFLTICNFVQIYYTMYIMGEIRAGQIIKLYSNAAYDSDKEFICTIGHVYNDRLELNLSEGVPDDLEFLEEGSEILVKIFTPSGVKIFDSIVLNSPLEPEFVIEFAEFAMEIQRREFIRVQLDTKVVIQRPDRTFVVAMTMDISGGGVRFLHKGTLTPGEDVKVTLYLPNTRFVEAKAKILDNARLPINQHVLVFTQIDEGDRDRIVKQCFDIQTAEYY